MNVAPWMWAGAATLIVAVLLVDLRAHRGDQDLRVRDALLWTAVWVGVGLGFGVLVWLSWGGEPAGEYFAGYLIEKSLAVDNIVVFAMIFAAFGVPRASQHRVLFLGVLGALVMRAGFIAAGAALVESASWVLFGFGALLVLTAWRLYRNRDEHPDPGRSRSYRLLSRIVPSVPDFDGPRFITRRAGRRVATPLLLVLAMIEVSDVIFAVDSIPAVFAVTTEPFLVFTSNAFAILGLRAMYFVLADLITRFRYLKTGLAVILTFVGLKMLLADVVHVPITVTLGVIGLALTVTAAASVRAAGRNAPVDVRAPAVSQL